MALPRSEALRIIVIVAAGLRFESPLFVGTSFWLGNRVHMDQLVATSLETQPE
jgi:hypothetical protein